VQGPIVDMTFCMEGEATIRISSIEAAR